MTHLLGVDPGKQGAIAIITNTGHLVDVVDMPDVTGAALGAAIRTLLDDWSPNEFAAAWIEEVGSRPGQGHMNVWTFAKNYGGLLASFGALGIPVHHVTTAAWRKTNRITTPASVPKDRKKAEGKRLSRQRATELWPEHAGLFRRVKDDGRAEAALIARHGLFVGEV